MKTRSVSKTMPLPDIKKICLSLLVLFAIMPGVTKAQTGVLTGTGMGVCLQFSFNTTTLSPSVWPLNYGSQGYACAGGATREDISFNPQGSLWRVQSLAWYFTTLSTAGGYLDGYDQSSNVIPSVYLPTNSTLTPISYTTIGTNNYVTFSLSTSGILPNLYNRNTYTISAY